MAYKRVALMVGILVDYLVAGKDLLMAVLRGKIEVDVMVA